MRRQGLRRLPLAALVGLCVAIVAAAVSGVTKPVAGLDFEQPGHWVASPELNSVSFINGSAKSVEAQVPIPGLEPGSQVVQGDTNGYVIGPTRITRFAKSNLAVENTITPPTGERPVIVEADGGPYLVFREAGTVARLGTSLMSIPAGGSLGDPVATPDGTLWLHRKTSGVLCELPKTANQITCPDLLSPGHTGALTVVGGAAVFVDTTSNSLQTVTGDGLGKAVPADVDISDSAHVAPAAADGRVAVLEPDSHRMYLVDASGVGGGQPARPPVTVDLQDGAYSNPTASESSVVLLDLTRHKVLTYGPDGVQRQAAPIPAETGQPQLVRGDDQRVYVDGGEGKHVMVVDPDGAVSDVAVAAPDKPPVVAPPVAPPPDVRGPDSVSPVTPSRRPTPPAPPAAPPVHKPVPASPPGIPGNVSASLQGANAVVSWEAAAANGAAVTSYQVSWRTSSGAGAGSATKTGSARSATITGLRAGIGYTVTVIAANSAGNGAPATTTVQGPALPTRTITVTRGRSTTLGTDCPAPDCAWMHIVVHGFAPKTTYHFDPHSSGVYHNDGGDFPTDANGDAVLDKFAFSEVGEQVWVTADGVSSPKITWPGG